MNLGSPIAISQAAQPTYELHSLGWKAFQHLCVSVTSEIWGQTVQGFFDSHDGGRDGAFHGTWIRKDGESFEGSFTVQCKSSIRSDAVLHLKDLRDELAKAKRLAEKGLADNYILFTSGRLTGSANEEIQAAFEAIPGVKRFAAYGVERISQVIRESSRLRMLVPRIYGLGDLSQILDERAYAQAREILSALGDDLEKFVITEAHQKAAKAVVRHGFVLLIGEPACGKSTIAAALAVGALDEWKCSTIKVRDADDFVKHSNPHEPKQFFWVDDAFGATQLDWQGTIRWNAALPHIQAAIRRGARVVFTSRNYIYNSAKNFLKESALPVLRDSQVVIEVEKITKEEKEQILYNHIRLGSQPASFKKKVKRYLFKVADHRNFGPEIARRLGNPTFTKRLDISTNGLENFVARPMDLLREIIQTLDADTRSALALVFMRGGVLPSPVKLTPEEEQAISLLGGAAAHIRNALVSLAGSLLIQVQQNGEFSWRFKHPTIRDAFAALVAENRELLDIYIVGTPVDQLLQEISCGDVRFDGVKVIVPEDRYGIIITRARGFLNARRENRDAVNRFLAWRCDKAFLAAYIADDPAFIGQLRIHSYLYAVSDVGVVARLHKLGLLPEAERERHVATIRELAVDTPDTGFLTEPVSSLFTDEEFADTLDHVRRGLLYDLGSCIESWEYNYSSNDDPENYFSTLKSALMEYREAFDNDDQALAFIDKGIVKIDKVVEDLQSELPPEPDSDDYFRGGVHDEERADARSTFDDVDQN
jgi:hypothetical protein